MNAISMILNKFQVPHKNRPEQGTCIWESHDLFGHHSKVQIVWTSTDMRIELKLGDEHQSFQLKHTDNDTECVNSDGIVLNKCQQDLILDFIQSINSNPHPSWEIEKSMIPKKKNQLKMGR